MSIFTSSSVPWTLDQAGLAWFNTLKNKYMALLPSLTAPTPPQAVAITEIKKMHHLGTVGGASLDQQRIEPGDQAGQDMNRRR